MISYLSRMVSWMLIIWLVSWRGRSWWCEHRARFAPANLTPLLSSQLCNTAVQIWFKLNIWSVYFKNPNPKVLWTTKQYPKASRCIYQEVPSDSRTIHSWCWCYLDAESKSSSQSHSNTYHITLTMQSQQTECTNPNNSPAFSPNPPMYPHIIRP